MNDFFATFYETFLGIYNPDFDLIFQTLRDSNSYIFFGLILFITPFIFFAGFYLLWKYPYGKTRHWLLFLLIVILITGAITWVTANNRIFLSNNQELIELINDSNTGFEKYANSLPLKYAAWNSFISIFLGSAYSLILKQFSKIQIHLPF